MCGTVGVVASSTAAPTAPTAPRCHIHAGRHSLVCLLQIQASTGQHTHVVKSMAHCIEGKR